MDAHGILLVDKPYGWSSFDIVAKVRGTLTRALGKKVKVGHTGTLDPLATGLMIVVVGSYCKRAQEFSKLDKTYEVTMKLGQTSTTGDNEGEKTDVSATQPSQEQLKTALAAFVGDSMQTPPAHSAIKINGKRAYKLAREGKMVVIEPRQVHISDITFTDYNYPHVNFTTDVSSGTYVRSLVQDIGETLQTGAYMSDLRRSKVGEFSLTDSPLDPQNISYESIEMSLRG
ncbi:MAG: tRNA pseudouridine(55) synthase TruB [Candidatus Saccharimonadales bacterium]